MAAAQPEELTLLLIQLRRQQARMATARQHALAQLQQLHASEVPYYPHTYSHLPNTTTTTTTTTTTAAALTSTATNGVPAAVCCPHAGPLAPPGPWGAQVGDSPQAWLISGRWPGRRGTVCLFIAQLVTVGRVCRSWHALLSWRP